MSMIIDKGKFKFIFRSTEQIKYTPNNLPIKKSKKNINISHSVLYQPKNNYNVFAVPEQKKCTQKNSFLKASQNNNNNNDEQKINHLTKKPNKSKKLKYNRTFEGNLLNIDNNKNEQEKENTNKNKNLIYNVSPNDNNSLIVSSSNNNNFKKQNGRFSVKNKTKNSINSEHNDNYIKNSSLTPYNNSNIDKIVKNNSRTIIKQLDNNFLSLENNIIDQKYESDIDHDEIIISSNKNSLTKNKNNSMQNLYNARNENNNFLCDIIGDSEINKQDNLLNCSFENNKADYHIMYVTNYQQSINDSMLDLEIKLIYDKSLELQKSYHRQLQKLLIDYKKNKNFINHYLNEIKKIEKKRNILMIKNLSTKNIETYDNILGNEENHNYNIIINNNRNEIQIWDSMLYGEQIKKLFQMIVFNKFYLYENILSDIQNKIIINFMKKYKFKNKLISEKNNQGILGSNNNNYRNINNKKILTERDIHGSGINIVNKNFNNKKKKKVFSNYQTKPFQSHVKNLKSK